MLDILDNHFKTLVKPLRVRGHTVGFALSINDYHYISRFMVYGVQNFVD
jgi:hypothetical protein